MIGKRFNRLVVIAEDGRKYGSAAWLCVCDCGNKLTVRGASLKNGNTESCGCLNRENTIKRNTSHGLSKIPEYKTWKDIKKRCFNQNHHSFDHYGGRGITISPLLENAFAMATDWRKSMLENLEKEGIVYAESHGSSY